MTYNDPAHSLTVFSLISVGFLMSLSILTVVINDWILFKRIDSIRFEWRIGMLYYTERGNELT